MTKDFASLARTVLVLACCAAPRVAFSDPQRDTDEPPPSSAKRLPGGLELRGPPAKATSGVPLALLSSAYTFVSEDGARATDGNFARLVFHPSGATFLLRQVKEQKSRAFEGTFSYRTGSLRLSFVTRGFQRAATFPLDLAASEVRLPFKVFSAGRGISIWQRDDSEDRLLDNVGDLCEGLVRARKAEAKATIPFLKKYLEVFVHPPGAPEIDVSPAPRVLSIVSFELSEGSLGVDVEEDGAMRHIGGDFCSCFVDGG